MTLRVRLVLTTLIVCVPLVGGMTWLYGYMRAHFFEESLSQFALLYMQAGGRAACEAAPTTWGGGVVRDDAVDSPWHASHHLHMPFVPQMYAYDRHFVSRNATAPPVPQDLQEAVRAGNAFAGQTQTLWVGHASVMQVLAVMPWTEGPCATILITRPSEHAGAFSPPLPPGRRMLPLQLLIPPAIALVSLLLTIGPVVRRIRRLTEAVQAAAQSRYEVEVAAEGRDEISELGRAFNAAAQQLREYIAVQDRREKTLRDFLENTTHDVMIPLTVLQGHLAALQEQAAHRSEGDLATVTAASREAHYIASLLHNLGVAAKLEAGEPAAQRLPVNLGEVVKRTVGRHAPMAKTRQLTLDYAIPESQVWVQGDVTLIEQALSNVVYNAVRYNHDGGHAAVILEQQRDGILLRVVDDGPGIEPAEASTLVDRYARGHAARSRGVHGQGLGLHIAWRVCAAHGWQMILRRSEFGGLQVDFIIPASLVDATVTANITE